MQNHMENRMVFEDSRLFGYTCSRHEFSCMDHKNEPDLSTRGADLGKALGRSRVENLLAWEEPNWRAGFTNIWGSAGFPKI